MSPSAARLAPLRTARRSRFEDTNQFESPTNTPLASPREAQSSGAQCEGGWADARGLTIAFDIVRLLPVRSVKPDAPSHSIRPRVCRESWPVKQLFPETRTEREATGELSRTK
jgi:hypothetical protein